MPRDLSRYARLLEVVFARHHFPGCTEFTFDRTELESAAGELNMEQPKNLGDILYSFRYRTDLPASIVATAPPDKEWIIRPAGRGKYRMAVVARARIRPTALLLEAKVLDATPGIVAAYAQGDEQALLAKLRYNRLVDTFTGVTCYSLQSHLRTAVRNKGQIETDEVYVGVDRAGAQYVFPVQAKGGRDELSIVQVEQDVAMCADRFSQLICRPIGAQFLGDGGIALFEFTLADGEIRVRIERHYRLVSSQELTEEDLHAYRSLAEF